MYCKFTSVAALIKDKDLVNFKFSDKENHMPVKSICIGEKTKSYVRKFSENEYTIFMAGIKRYYIKMSERLLKNLSLKNSVLADFHFLDPSSRKIENEKQIMRMVKKLPPGSHVKENDYDLLSLEWKLYVLESIPNEWIEDVPIDRYWTFIFKIKSGDALKYPLIKR